MILLNNLKKKYDNDQTIVKNVFELLDTEEKRTIKNINLPNIQNRYADMFFVYDCQKLGFSQAKIQSKIDRYYEDLDPNSPTISINTIKKYQKIAIEYIDNQKYKQLVT